MNRADWKHTARAMQGLFGASYPSGGLFVGTQAGCAQAHKDCQVPVSHRYMAGLNKGQYQLASTGKVAPKLLKNDLYGRPVVY
jgi:hypothetical protein